MTFEDQTILVTGGTGSFGKKFIRLLLDEHSPKQVIVLSRDELKQHEMRLAGFTDSRLLYFIGDIRDAERMHRALDGVDILVHAAALKQVPACEENPIEAVRTNITGAENLINAAIANGVKKVLALSTDKAVNPSNLYGATKQVMEKLFVQANAYNAGDGPIFSCVRYGNVIGSRGSIVPLFRKQRESGKVTVTDDRMTRFWITLDQGTRFVTSSIEMMRGGEVFIPKIPSTNIMDIVAVLAPDCEVETIGIRPGEKLHEVLVGEDESRHTRDIGDRYVVEPLHGWYEQPDNAGELLEPGVRYASDNNTEWLVGDELATMIETHAP